MSCSPAWPLFTEDFLVPVTTVIARQARFRMLLRLWAATLLANLVAGWCFTWLILKGFPQFSETALKAGGYYVELGLGGRAFALAVIGGAVITLMTWMQHSTASSGLKLVPAVTGGFLLAGAQLNHAVVNSLLIFSALHAGRAPFGYVDWLQTAGLAAAGNMVGGLLLVTLVSCSRCRTRSGRSGTTRRWAWRSATTAERRRRARSRDP